MCIRDSARTFRAHLLELTADLPRVCPCSIVQRITNRVVGDRLTVVRRQFILPVAVAIDVGDRLNRRSDCARGVGILDLTQNVSAAVVVVHPCCILMWIVHTNQLAQRVVLIRRGQVAVLLAGDVPAVIVLYQKATRMIRPRKWLRDNFISNLY